MKATRRLFLLATALCIATGMTGQGLYDASGGTTIGRISNNRIYDASDGTTIGRIEGERILDGGGGRTLNYIKSDGRVMDGSGGYTVGYIKSNGQVMDKSGGYTLGYVENGNVYDKSHGTRIGRYSGVAAKYAAYYYFFFPDRKVNTTAAAKKAAATTTKQAAPRVTNALEAPVKQTPLYDRNRQTLGTLYGTERYLSVNASKDGYVFTFKKGDEGITVNLHDKYLCNIGKDKKTVYINSGKDVYCIIDEQGNAFDTDGSQFGKIESDGRIAVDSPRHPDCTLGYVGGSGYDRQLVGVLFFVCYYNMLFDVYAEIDKQKAAKADSLKAATAKPDSVK